MLLNKNIIRVMSYVHKSDLPHEVKIIIACSNNAGWQKVETLMMLKTGLTFGLLAVVWRRGEEAGKGQRAAGGEKGREGNKQPGLVIQGKVIVKKDYKKIKSKNEWMKLIWL